MTSTKKCITLREQAIAKEIPVQEKIAELKMAKFD